MPRKKQPKFQVGDVFVWERPKSDPRALSGAPITISGVVFKYTKHRVTEFKESVKVMCFDMERRVFWYGYFGNMHRCKGMKDINLCKQCEHSSLCSHLRDIVRCDISEFGQLRREGKYNPDICKQRQCKHLWVCGTKRFIQK